MLGNEVEFLKAFCIVTALSKLAYNKKSIDKFVMCLNQPSPIPMRKTGDNFYTITEEPAMSDQA
jgi:hypothetical protein